MSTRSSKTSAVANNVVATSPPKKLKKTSTIKVTPPEKPKLKQVFKSLKKPAKSKLSHESVIATYYDDIHTATVSEFIVGTVFKKSGKAGFVWPLIKAIYESNEDIHAGRPNNGLGKKLADRTKFDCRIQKNLFLRKSREVDERINLNIANKTLYQLGVICCPDKGVVSNFKVEKIQPESFYEKRDIQYEELFRDEIENVLREGTKKMGGKKNVVTSYSAWDPLKHSKGNDTDRYLDMIFTDESVEIILMEYYIEPDLEREKVYEWLNESGLWFNCFYSRLNGYYSQYAIKNFGYPEDCVIPSTFQGSKYASKSKDE